jgi:hypothetical protein
MTDPRKLAEDTLHSATLRDLVPRQNQNALAHELLKALDECDRWRLAHMAVLRDLYTAGTERDRLQEALARVCDFKLRVAGATVDDLADIARAALDVTAMYGEAKTGDPVVDPLDYDGQQPEEAEPIVPAELEEKKS